MTLKWKIRDGQQKSNLQKQKVKSNKSLNKSTPTKFILKLVTRGLPILKGDE